MDGNANLINNKNKNYMCIAMWKKKKNNNYKKENHFVLKLGSHPKQ